MRGSFSLSNRVWSPTIVFIYSRALINVTIGYNQLAIYIYLRYLD